MKRYFITSKSACNFCHFITTKSIRKLRKFEHYFCFITKQQC